MSQEEVFGWLFFLSAVMFVGSLLAVPAIILRLPADYFHHHHRHAQPPAGSFRALYYAWLVLKNLLGVILVVMGLAMLVLPGQGILSMLIGLSLTNFPGKYRLERFIAGRAPIRKSLNWIRVRAGVAPLIFNDEAHQP